MRRLTDPARLAALMRALGHAARAPGRVYLTGGSTALLLGWRTSTMDVDLHLDPGAEPLLRELPRLKEELEINVELAAPSQFVPELPGWRERSLFIAREGSIDFYHYDLYSQALSKIERGHALDLEDVRQMIEREHVARPRLAELFVRVEPELYRYPAIDPATLRRRVAAICAAWGAPRRCGAVGGGRSRPAAIGLTLLDLGDGDPEGREGSVPGPSGDGDAAPRPSPRSLRACIKTSVVLCCDVMRTTLTLDDDVAALLRRIQERQGVGWKDLVNQALRAGLASLERPKEKTRKPFRTPEVRVGRMLIDLESVSQALAVAEGEDHR